MVCLFSIFWYDLIVLIFYTVLEWRKERNNNHQADLNFPRSPISNGSERAITIKIAKIIAIFTSLKTLWEKLLLNRSSKTSTSMALEDYPGIKYSRCLMALAYPSPLRTLTNSTTQLKSTSRKWIVICSKDALSHKNPIRSSAKSSRL